MAINSKRIQINTEHTHHYPCLMISPNDNIILFSAPNTGIILDAGPGSSSQVTGKLYTSFAMKGMMPYQGEVILSNKTV